MAKKNEDMTWEELEEMFGIRLEKPNEKNRKVAKDAGVVTDEPPATTHRVEDPVVVDVPEVVIEERPAPPVEKPRQKKTLPRVEAQVPDTTPRYTYVEYEASTQPSVREAKKEGNHQVTRTAQSRVIHKSDIRKGILWSEILQPPLAKRKR